MYPSNYTHGKRVEPPNPRTGIMLLHCRTGIGGMSKFLLKRTHFSPYVLIASENQEMNSWFFKLCLILGSEDTFGTFCPFMGKFQLNYQSYTNGQFCYELSNCKGSHELEIKTFDCQLRNEPFDEVRIEKYQCLGHWPSDFPGKYFGVMKSKTQYKCIVSISTFFFTFFPIFSFYDFF